MSWANKVFISWLLSSLTWVECGWYQYKVTASNLKAPSFEKPSKVCVKTFHCELNISVLKSYFGEIIYDWDTLRLFIIIANKCKLLSNLSVNVMSRARYN